MGVSSELNKLRVQQGIYADRVARPAVPLNTGEKVRLQTGSREWIAAKVVANTQYPRSVIVETNNGKRYRRNNHHLHKTKANIQSQLIVFPQSQAEISVREHTPIQLANQEANQPIKTRSGRIIRPSIRYHQ